MKICWLIPDDRSGGVASVAQACCQQLAQLNYVVTLLTVLTPIGRIKPSKMFKLDSLYLEESAESTPNTLLEWLKSNPQNIIFLNGCEQADSVISYLPENLYCIYVVHDTASRYWKNAVQNEDNLNGIVAVSRAVSLKFKNKLKEPNKLSIIHNGCQFPKFDHTLEKRANDIIFLGGDKPIKGAFDILGSWQYLIQRGFTGRLHWFGGVSENFQKKIVSLPSSEQIILYGHVPRDLIFSTAAVAKVFLMLSRVEPFGMATIEAMSMGCVPIAWDIETGTKEIIDESTGIFIPLGKTKLLAEKVLEVMHSHPRFEASVIDHARTYFNSEAMGRNYDALLKSLVTHPHIHRSKSGQVPPNYQQPIRKFQLLPKPIRSAVQQWVGHSPILGYLLRDLRGF